MCMCLKGISGMSWPDGASGCFPTVTDFDASTGTTADPEGRTVLGKLNNCGAGRTPWGTDLTCGENFNGYFGDPAAIPAEGDSDEVKKAKADEADKARPSGTKRYGIGGVSRYRYEQFDARFDLTQNPNEPNRHGFIGEIDPSNPDALPVKQTALGRFKHENAATVLVRDGRLVVYMGDDERGEFLYRWVSRDAYVPGGGTSTLLVEGTLSVARFTPDGAGAWLDLTPRGDRHLRRRNRRLHPDRSLEGGGHHDGPPGMGGGKPGRRRRVSCPDQQHPPQVGGNECRWRRDGSRAEQPRSAPRKRL